MGRGSGTIPEPALQGVSKTALGVAVVRAAESRRDDRLFDDPYAQRFVDAAPGAFPERAVAQHRTGASGRWSARFAVHTILRTRFFDDFLLEAAASGCAQVVLLAAGLDTRALRLPWPGGVRVFELDLPEVFAFKEPALTGCAAEARCERTIIPVDLREDWPAALIGSGLDPGAPAAWLAEGLLLYLTADEAARLLDGVGRLSAPGSRLAFERGGIADSGRLARAKELPGMAQYTAFWKGGLGEDAPDWLRQHGWTPQLHSRIELAAASGRAVPEDSDGGFLTAQR
jgi:methyltransferase (TIGR00027 family)